jgi:hypothetical protein
MSFQYAKINYLDVAHINGGLPDSVSLVNNNSNGRFYFPFYNLGTGSTNTFYTNSKVQVNPSTGALYCNSLLAGSGAPLTIQSTGGATTSILADGGLTVTTGSSGTVGLNSGNGIVLQGGSNSTSIISGSGSGSWIWPGANGTAGQVLTEAGYGNQLTWSSPPVGPTTGSMVANVYDSSSPSTQLGTIGMQFFLDPPSGVVTVVTQGMSQSLLTFADVTSFPVVNTGNVPAQFLPSGGYSYATGNGIMNDGTYIYNLPIKISFGSAGGILFQANLADTNSGGWGSTAAYPTILAGVYQYTLNPVTPPV